MKLLPSLFAVALLLAMPGPQGCAEAPGSELASKAKAKHVAPKVRAKVNKHLKLAAKMIMLRQPKPAMHEVEKALYLDPDNKRAQAYRLVLGEILELGRIHPQPAAKQLNGTAGNWRGCRGTGAHVCAEKIPPGYGRYWKNHPKCIPNTTCKKSYFTCNKACPPPSEADRD
ncbi:MAG: hypothetical protein JRF33_12055 [Deltaproteobacteria bacterium]|nr:hypothetical protein [Deltaproteobacteria bacterium]